MNERDGWKLLGGRIGIGETPAECVEREVQEEVSLSLSAQEFHHYYLFEVATWALITCYCKIQIQELKVLV